MTKTKANGLPRHPRGGRYFEDFVVGETIRHGLTRALIRNMVEGVATMLDFSNCSRVIVWCNRAYGLCMALACALMEKGAKSACLQPYSCM